MESNTLRPDTPLPVNPNTKGHTNKHKSVSPLSNELLVAARKGHTDEVKRIISEVGGSGAAAIQSVLDRHGRNCLHLACHYGQSETVKAILDSNTIDINCTSKRGFTPLHEASGEGHLNIVFLLLGMEASIIARSKEGWTSLMSACYNGHIHIVRVLIAAGLNVNTTNKNGFTALHVAAWRGNTSIVELLIKEGAHIDALTASKKSALDIAQEEDQFETIRILTAALSRNSEDPTHRIAALEGQLKLAQEKILELQQKHEEILKAEREEMMKNFNDIKKQLLKDTPNTEERVAPSVVNGDTSTKINSQPKNNEVPTINIQASSPKTIATTSNKTTPTVVKGSAPIKHHRGGEQTNKPVMVSPLLQRHSRSPVVPKLQPRKKEGTTIVDSLCLESVNMDPSGTAGRRIRHSLDEGADSVLKPPLGSNSEKLTIAQLVESYSIKNSETIASIKKQLKEDNLTPRIQKKFDNARTTGAVISTINHRPSGRSSSLPIEGRLNK